jgi:hypothetical protein
VSEFEEPDLVEREATVEDVRRLIAASTPHFALQLRNRIQNLIADLPPDHPARIEGERELDLMEEVAHGSEQRGGHRHGEPALPSLEAAVEAAEPA